MKIEMVQNVLKKVLIYKIMTKGQSKRLGKQIQELKNMLVWSKNLKQEEVSKIRLIVHELNNLKREIDGRIDS